MNTNEHQYRVTRWRALRMAGGFVVQVGDRLYDASVKSQLATLRKGFSSNLYVNNLR